MGLRLKGFVEGGIATTIAGSSTHPLDLIKVRMQLHGETLTLAQTLSHHALAFNPTSSLHAPPPPRLGPLSVALKIAQIEGPAALFTGVSATVLRQLLYSTTCIGLYDILKQHRSKSMDSNPMPLREKIAAGLISGGIGATVGNPADVAMVRMQADGRLSAAQRRNYKNAFDAIVRMTKDEGFTSLWRGSGLTVKRAMVVTAAQLASYDQIKEFVMEKCSMRDGVGTHTVSSAIAGFIAAVASTPIDVIKTRVMNMNVESGGMPPYKGALDCAVKTVRSEGVMALYKGFVPTVSRQGPFTVVLFVTLEQVRKVLKDF